MGWTPEEAIGRQLTINEGTATIIGVVRDFHNNSLQDEITPCILINWSYFLERAHIQLERTSDLSKVLPFIESAWRETYPEGIFNVTFLDDALAKNYAIEQLVFKGFTSFAILAIIIGCLGLYGLISFVSIRKTKEIGIRKVLGASVASILQLFSKEFVLLVLLAFVIAAPLSYYFMNQWLTSFVYHIALSWWIFVLSALLTITIALFTISFQTIKAALSNPVESLRSE